MIVMLIKYTKSRRTKVTIAANIPFIHLPFNVVDGTDANDYVDDDDDDEADHSDERDASTTECYVE